MRTSQGVEMSALGCGLGAIHPSAWNKNSANFAFWGFSEVRIATVQHL
jgi:hypothetical protein